MFEISKINKKRYTKGNYFFLIILAFSVTLYLLINTIDIGLNKVINNLDQENDELKTIEIYPLNTFFKEEIITDSFIENLYNINEKNNLLSYYGIEGLSADIQMNFMEYDINIKDYIDSRDFSYDIFTNTEKSEIKVGKPFFLPRENEIKVDNAIYVEENLVKILGYTPEQVVGKTVDLFYGERKHQLKIVNVFNSELGHQFFSRIDLNTYTEDEINNLKNKILSEGISGPFILDKNAAIEIFENSVEQFEVLVEAESIFEVREITEFVKLNSDYFHISSISILDMVINILEKVEIILIALIISTAVISLLIIVSSVYLQIREQRKFISMLIILGCAKKKIISNYIYSRLVSIIKFFLICLVMYSLVVYILEQNASEYFKEIAPNINKVFTFQLDLFLITMAIILLVYTLIFLATIKYSINYLVKENIYE